MRNVTQEEWLAEAKERFGGDVNKWRFVCPACGHIQMVQDFLDAGAEVNDSYQNCIGRFTGKGSPKKGDDSGCNWAAYGLLGTLGNGLLVENIEVFEFANESKG